MSHWIIRNRQAPLPYEKVKRTLNLPLLSPGSLISQCYSKKNNMKGLVYFDACSYSKPIISHQVRKKARFTSVITKIIVTRLLSDNTIQRQICTTFKVIQVEINTCSMTINIDIWKGEPSWVDRTLRLQNETLVTLRLNLSGMHSRILTDLTSPERRRQNHPGPSLAWRHKPPILFGVMVSRLP